MVHVREFRSLLHTHKQVSDVIMQKKTHVHVSEFIFTQRDPCVTDDEVCSNIDYYFFIIVSGNHWLWVVSDGDGCGGGCAASCICHYVQILEVAPSAGLCKHVRLSSYWV